MVWICKPSILGQFDVQPNWTVNKHPIWTDWPALASNKQWAKVPLHKLCPVFEKINWSTHPPRSLCADVCAGVEKGEGGFLVWEFPFKTDEQVVLYSDKYNIGGHRTHLKNNREAITVCFAFDHMFDNLKKKEKRESNMNTGIHNKLAVFKRVLWRNFSWLRSNYRNYYLVSKSHTMLSFTILCVNLGCWTKMLMIVCWFDRNLLLLAWQHLLLVLFFPTSVLATPHMTNTEEPGVINNNSTFTFQLKKNMNATSQREQTRGKQGRGGRKASCIYLLVGRAWCWGNREQLLTAKDVQREESRTTNCFKGLQVEQGRAGTGDVHLQAGKVSAVQSCDQSRSEQLFPSFLAWNWLLLCYLLFLASFAGDHLMSHILPSARVTF